MRTKKGAVSIYKANYFDVDIIEKQGLGLILKKKKKSQNIESQVFGFKYGIMKRKGKKKCGIYYSSPRKEMKLARSMLQ